MKNLSLSIALISIFILLLSLFLLPAKPINSPEQLSSLLPNQKIMTAGKVIKETSSKNYKVIKLDNSIELRCEINCPSYLNKNISALAISKPYNNKVYLYILKIKNI